MKKLLLLVSIIFCGATSVAQEDGDVSYGFRLGANYSTLSGDNDRWDDVNSRIGIHASFFGQVPLSDSFSLQPELGVSALGINENEVRLENGDNVQLKTNWLQVSVLARLDLGRRLFVLLGPQAGVNVTERDNNDYYNYDFAAVGGLGYKMDENWAVDLRYGYGLSNIFDREFADLEDANNRWFQIGVSYKL
ncbi:porin family protein [uncultured Nonlabens sp.]|uniref:porin family protein n=1 Tax=uncultured Nonlabens sp. TaxID=859306 RepID=UPI00262A8372|nr:porin family protein [uncultured Nonlabens sp.]